MLAVPSNNVIILLSTGKQSSGLVDFQNKSSRPELTTPYHSGDMNTQVPGCRRSVGWTSICYLRKRMEETLWLMNCHWHLAFSLTHLLSLSPCSLCSSLLSMLPVVWTDQTCLQLRALTLAVFSFRDIMIWVYRRWATLWHVALFPHQLDIPSTQN